MTSSSKDDILVVGALAAELPLSMVPKGLRKLRESGSCEFCRGTVYVNRLNIAGLRDEGKTPVLICTQCYGEGAHIRGGFKGVNN